MTTYAEIVKSRRTCLFMNNALRTRRLRNKILKNELILSEKCIFFFKASHIQSVFLKSRRI